MSGTNLASMAWRNLWRNKRRTLLTLISISFGIFLAVFFTGLGDRSWKDTIDLAAKMGNGHVTIQHPDYQDRPSLKRTVEGVDGIEDLVRREADVVHVTRRITGQTMLATAGKSYGAMFIAFDPGNETEDSMALLDALEEGEMFETADEQGILLGSKLAENLGVGLGKKVVYTMTDKDGEIVSDLVRVKGIVTTGAESLDASLCLLPIDTIRETLGYAPDESTHVAVFLTDHRDSEQVAARLDGLLSGRNVAAIDWSIAQPELAGFITMKVSGTTFFEIVVAILIAAGIFNTLFVSVMERLREFGILLAVGFSPGRLFGLVMWESLWLALVGIGVGALLTAGPYYQFWKNGIDFSAMVGGQDGGSSEIAGVAIDPTFYIGLYPESAVFIALAVIAGTLLAGLYPAWRAGRVDPVETIKVV